MNSHPQFARVGNAICRIGGNFTSLDGKRRFTLHPIGGSSPFVGMEESLFYRYTPTESEEIANHLAGSVRTTTEAMTPSCPSCPDAKGGGQ